MKTFAISGKESKDQQAYDPKKLVMVLPVKKWFIYFFILKKFQIINY